MEGNHKLYTSGFCKKNPGPSGCRAILKSSTNLVLDDRHIDLGEGTNNTAEYNGVLLGLQMAQFYEIKAVDIFLYSELVGNQLKGIYKVKNYKLLRIYETVKDLMSSFTYCEVHIISKSLILEDEKIASEISRMMI